MERAERPKMPNRSHIGFKESLQDWKLRLIRRRKSTEMPLLLDLRPAPPAHFADGSLVFWIWLVVLVAVAVGCGIALSLRR
jgi:hypothetical protein